MNFYPVAVTLFAGLATVLGALFVSKNRDLRTQGFALSFATGIMLMIALGELIPESVENLGTGIALLMLALGAFLSLLLDLILPHHHDHEEEHALKQPGHFIDDCECAHHNNVSKGMITALLLHNVLEGLATGITAFNDAKLGFSMALGIALHNIPIGATLGISLQSAGNSKGKSLLKVALVGLSQPLGALIGLMFFEIISQGIFLSSCMSIVAGILIFISFDELWPAARNSGSRNLNIFALIVGICFIPITEILL